MNQTETNMTYRERVGRYRIIRHEELPEHHKAEYRALGIDPDDRWSLIWSFDTLEAAERGLVDCNEDKAWFQTYKLVDAGQEEYIERSVW